MSRVQFEDRDDDGVSMRSVGKMFDEGQVYGLDHPAYKAFSSQLENELGDIARREATRRRAMQPVILPHSVSSEEVAALAGMYPEFEVVPVPLNYPVHRFYTASQGLANDLVLASAKKYADDVVHLGGSRLSTMMHGYRDVHLEYCTQVPVAAQRHHAGMVDLHRVFRDYTYMQTDFGMSVPRGEFDAYLRGDAYCVCSDMDCLHKADALCVDLSVYAMSVEQVASAMLQHSSQVAFGFFVYHPMMLVKESGELPHTGVYYRKTNDEIQLDYPDGQVGFSTQPLASWAGWLAGHTFRVPGTDKWFQLELMKNRGCFMFFRMVAVPVPSGACEIRHAMELPDASDAVLVKSWRLKDGMKGDPTQVSSWVPHNFLVAERTERRVREFAMQLQTENFDRFAIKKQIRVVNNRWVLSGTTVTVMPPLEPGEIEDLTTAIFARVFVDRYESGRLSSQMMSTLASLKKFDTMTVPMRMLVIAMASVGWLYDHTLPPFWDRMRKSMDAFINFVWGSVSLDKVAVVPAPRYVVFSSSVGSLMARLKGTGELRDVLANAWRRSGFDTRLPGGKLAVAVTATLGGECVDDALQPAVRVLTDYVDMSARVDSQAADEYVAVVRANNPLDVEPTTRHVYEYEQAERDAGEVVQLFRQAASSDPVEELNQLYREAFGAVARQSNEFDSHHLSLDPQDRTLAAMYLRAPTYFGDAPRDRLVYTSKIEALNIPVRQNTRQELLTAMGERNMSAPALAHPQDEKALIEDVWESFLTDWCVPEAREKLLEFQRDPVALGEQAMKDWTAQAKPEVVQRVIREMDDTAFALGDKNVGEYLAMIKAEVKPTLSNKPVGKVVPPQVIVYHEKALSSLYSCMFRVIVRRFLSLLKSSVHVNLLKDTKDISAFVTANHPFGRSDLKFLENDFSQYDKSQAGFVFALEEFVFRKLGLNEDFLQRWVIGHQYATVRSVALGITLHVMYQRKSGDATTSLGNVITNVLTVHYAYRGTPVSWAVFMGDDSLVCATGAVVGASDAVRILAEKFNLIAKYYITESPYFASNFVVLNDATLTAVLVPDPVKRIEKLSMSVNGDDPQWQERWQSCVDTLSGYLDVSNVVSLSRLVPQRYAVPEGFVRGAATALGTLASSFRAFRNVWSEDPVLLNA